MCNLSVFSAEYFSKDFGVCGRGGTVDCCNGEKTLQGAVRPRAQDL